MALTSDTSIFSNQFAKGSKFLHAVLVVIGAVTRYTKIEIFTLSAVVTSVHLSFAFVTSVDKSVSAC